MQITESQINAALRHVGSYGGGAVTALATLGFMNPDDAKALIAALNQTIDGLNQATAGLSKIIYIVGPIMGTLGAVYAAKSASVRSQLAAIIGGANKTPEVKAEVLKSVADKVEGVQAVVADPMTAATAMSAKVVSQ